tara:strand:- start:412 stop:525 length:114 start_codon:yes stop_codon:yes gene_type:complete
MKEMIEYLIFTALFIAASATLIWIILAVLTTIFQSSE